MERSAQLIQRRALQGKLLNEVFAVADAVRMPCADFTNPIIQNAFYEEFTRNLEITM